MVIKMITTISNDDTRIRGMLFGYCTENVYIKMILSAMYSMIYTQHVQMDLYVLDFYYVTITLDIFSLFCSFNKILKKIDQSWLLLFNQYPEWNCIGYRICRQNRWILYIWSIFGYCIFNVLWHRNLYG